MKDWVFKRYSLDGSSAVRLNCC